MWSIANLFKRPKVEEQMYRLEGDRLIPIKEEFLPEGFADCGYYRPCDVDEDEWNPAFGFDRNCGGMDLNSLKCLRDLVESNPYLRRALKLYTDYVFGSEFSVSAVPLAVPSLEYDEKQQKKHDAVAHIVTSLVNECHQYNARGWSPMEWGKRVYRDGEQFTYLPDDSWPIRIRFIDPETIGETNEAQKDCGIITSPEDVATVTEYREIDPNTKSEKRMIPASRVVHTRLDVDSTVKRGRSRFATLGKTLKRVETFVDTEVKMRAMQSSVVMVRKVNGTPQTARLLLDNTKTSTKTSGDLTLNRERIAAGSMMTTSKGVDVEFKQPDTNFQDASPILAMLIKQIASVTGWTYPMLSMDTGEGNLANSLVQEGPVYQMVWAERVFFKPDLIQIYTKVVSAGLASPKYSALLREAGVPSVEDFWKEYELSFVYGDIVTKDQVKNAQAFNLGVLNGSFSHQEFCRRMKVDPNKMIRERQAESGMKGSDDMPLFNNAGMSQMPSGDDMLTSSDSNAKGDNTSKGDKPVSHRDNAGVGSSQKA